MTASIKLLMGILVAAFAVAAGAAASGVLAVDSSSGRQRANQVVPAGDSGAVSSPTSKAAQGGALPVQPAGSVGLIDDLGLVSSSRVVHSGIGLLIRNTKASNVAVAIHDAKGRAVHSSKYGPGSKLINIPTRVFPAGVYVYTVKMADSVYTNPFIITR